MTRRSTLVGVAVVALLAAVATGIYSVTAGGGSAPTASMRHRSVTAPCSAAAGWRIEPGPGWSEPTGRNTAPIVLVRTGSTPCVLRGYPTIVLRDSGGRTIPFRYTHRGDMVVTSKPPRTVRVGHDGSAFFLFDKYRCDVHETDVARSLLVRLPGVRGRLRLRMGHHPIIDYCPVGGPSTTIAVSPIVGTLSQAAAKLP